MQIILNTNIHTSKENYRKGIIYDIDKNEFETLKLYIDVIEMRKQGIEIPVD